MDAPKARTAMQVQPNVTPMIDVALVLLIVFTVMMPMLGTGYSPVPPTATNLAAHPKGPTDATLGIDRDGNYYLNKHTVRASMLETRLHRIFASRTDDRVLYLLADRNLDYGVVHEALDMAARSGARVVGLVSEQRSTTRSR